MMKADWWFLSGRDRQMVREAAYANRSSAENSGTAMLDFIPAILCAYARVQAAELGSLNSAGQLIPFRRRMGSTVDALWTPPLPCAQPHSGNANSSHYERPWW
jgi:hypothetical protein